MLWRDRIGFWCGWQFYYSLASWLWVWIDLGILQLFINWYSSRCDLRVPCCHMLSRWRARGAGAWARMRAVVAICWTVGRNDEGRLNHYYGENGKRRPPCVTDLCNKAHRHDIIYMHVQWAWGPRTPMFVYRWIDVWRDVQHPSLASSSHRYDLLGRAVY